MYNTPNIHPAFEIKFDDLYRNLLIEVANGNVDVNQKNSLYQFNYSRICQYNKNWNDVTRIARGIILDVDSKKIYPTFPKFFNIFEENISIPDLPFSVSLKEDGSLGIIYYYQNQWFVNTKGSFNSNQSIWATRFLRENLPVLDINITYLVEIIFPDNRIVVDYHGWEGLILIGAYNNITGEELNIYEQKFPFIVCDYTKYRLAQKYEFNCLSEILNKSKLPYNNTEGYVVRFNNGYRLKIKNEEYVRLHRAISNISPLAIWDLLVNNCDKEEWWNLDHIKVNIPEEFWKDFDAIKDILVNTAEVILHQAADFIVLNNYPSRKEWAIEINKLNSELRSPCYQLLDNKSVPYVISNILKSLRPTHNILTGYIPTSSMNRFQQSVE